VIETNLHNHDLPRLENATRYAAKIVMDLGTIIGRYLSG